MSIGEGIGAGSCNIFSPLSVQLGADMTSSVLSSSGTFLYQCCPQAVLSSSRLCFRGQGRKPQNLPFASSLASFRNSFSHPKQTVCLLRWVLVSWFPTMIPFSYLWHGVGQGPCRTKPGSW